MPNTLSNVELTDILRKNEEALFGEMSHQRNLTTRVISRGSRIIHLAQRTDHPSSRPVIVKERPCVGASPQAMNEVAEEIHREFRALQLASERLATTTTDGTIYQVPGPLLALPDRGLLCMERCEGVPLRRLLRSAVAKPWNRGQVTEILARCGQWLRRFATINSTEASHRIEANVRHTPPYVYALIGLRGPELAETMVHNATERLRVFGYSREETRLIAKALRMRTAAPEFLHAPLVPVHGKFTSRDVFVTQTSVSVVDFEYAGNGVPYLDPAFLVYELYLVNRWNFLTGRDSAKKWRVAFLSAYEGVVNQNPEVLNCFIAYFMINSLKARGGVAGALARRFASRWLGAWARHCIATPHVGESTR